MHGLRIRTLSGGKRSQGREYFGKGFLFTTTMNITVKIDSLEFAAQIDEDGRCLIEIIFPIGDTADSRFVELEDLKSALKFLETEVNR